MQVSGTLTVGESASALAYIKGRRGLSPRFTKLTLVACMFVVGIPAGAWATGSWLDGLLGVEFGVLGLLLGVFLVNYLIRITMRAALARRRQSAEHVLTMSLTPERLVFDLEDIQVIATWACVTDLFRAPRHWVFLVQSTAMVLPRRVFADAGAERAFIAEALSRMPQAARDRSPDAARFVEA